MIFMSNQQSRSHIQAPLPATASRWPWLIGGVVVLAAIGLGLTLARWDAPAPRDDERNREPVITEEHRLCLRFQSLKNASDPGAMALLDPTPALPSGPVSPEEADHIQADLFLREAARVEGVTPDRTGMGRFVLSTKGNVAAPTLEVALPGGKIERSQRTMTNPNIHVEVRNGRIHGVRAALGQ